MPIEMPFERAGYLFPRETSDGCIFHDATTKRCRIQSFKPELCVAYPVTFDVNLDTETIEWYLHTDEVCQLSGVLYRDSGKLKKHLESAKREINAFIRGLQNEELITILTIEVPDTLKIGEDPVESEVLARLKQENP
jgi:Fe-S-cluster containining protein